MLFRSWLACLWPCCAVKWKSSSGSRTRWAIRCHCHKQLLPMPWRVLLRRATMPPSWTRLCTLATFRWPHGTLITGSQGRLVRLCASTTSPTNFCVPPSPPRLSTCWMCSQGVTLTKCASCCREFRRSCFVCLCTMLMWSGSNQAVRIIKGQQPALFMSQPPAPIPFSSAGVIALVDVESSSVCAIASAGNLPAVREWWWVKEFGDIGLSSD